MGSIPPTLSSLSFLGYLNLSNNNFSGTIPNAEHLTTFDASSFAGNPALCGPPLNVKCMDEDSDGGGSVNPDDNNGNEQEDKKSKASEEALLADMALEEEADKDSTDRKHYWFSWISVAAMGERSKSSLGIITHKSLFSLFTIASILFFLSWFFVLRSTSTDGGLFTNTNANSNPLHVVNNGNSEARIRNRAILNDSVEEEEVELPQKKCNTKTKAILKVYMYDLSPEFHFELLDWKAQGVSVWPDVTKNIPQYPTVD
ncbi:hypothetical protein EZV62_012072 [Acer yangbiense]|uniref:Uncharacterized protein n=1 Tax=Acer yangbiense TaxID=1000413 RepID=A0A5C7I7P3_9ROSI|nr:hypothetical protein EZV62_012072 [Acer yangbiense]